MGFFLVSVQKTQSFLHCCQHKLLVQTGEGAAERVMVCFSYQGCDEVRRSVLLPPFGRHNWRRIEFEWGERSVIIPTCARLQWEGRDEAISCLSTGTTKSLYTSVSYFLFWHNQSTCPFAARLNIISCFFYAIYLVSLHLIGVSEVISQLLFQAADVLGFVHPLCKL